MVIYDGKGNSKWDTHDRAKNLDGTKWELGHEGWFWLELRHDGKLKLYNAGDGAMWTG